MTVSIPHQYPTDLNKPADADDLWLDRSVMIPEQRRVIEVPLRRVAMTPSMRKLLTALRERAGLSQWDVAMEMGHTQGWLSNIETGRVQTIDEDAFDALLALYQGES